MKKVLLIIVGLFLIGCQTNDQVGEEQNGMIDKSQAQKEELDIQQDNNDESEINQNQHEEEDSAGNDDEGYTSKEDEHDSSEQTDNEDGTYSPDDAIALVMEFVQGSKTDTELNYLFDGEDEDGNYRIQVFEVVDHGGGESHTATYGWYLVDPKTGEITDLMNQ